MYKKSDIAHRDRSNEREFIRKPDAYSRLKSVFSIKVMEQRRGKKTLIRLVFVQVPFNQNGIFPKRKKAQKKNQQPNYHILILFYKEDY